MQVLIFHGYLLRGTGSNVYNANLAQALSRLGHDVRLLCQDPDAESIPWVDAVGTWDGEAFEVTPTSGSSPGPGSITAYRPDIGGLLPVYVRDKYTGFEVKTFSDLTDEELDRYIDLNVAAVRAVSDGVEAALSNHLVMGPLILARAGLGFAAKIHGSALSYTVRPDPRFLPYAKEGMTAANGVLTGSRHTAESLWETLDDPDLPGKTRLGPPGVDVEEFARPAGDDPVARIRSLAAELRPAAGARTEVADDADTFARDAGEAADALEAFASGGADDARVIFVGKLIVSKGCDLLLAAWPFVAAANPGARLLMVGFGAYRVGLERLWGAITGGELEEARRIAASGWALEGGEEKPLQILSAFLADPPDGWTEACAAAAGSVAFAGRLEHAEVGRLLPATDAMVVPSTFPEAFGMVAAEAAAAGSLPVCANHSGLAEVAAALDADLPESARGMTSFELAPGAIEEIAEHLNDWLALPAPEREAARVSLAATVARLWSWEGVARGVLEAADGRLDDLPPIPAS
jgi:glycosyltransferase involved in cell wall biosynthesis